MNETTKEILWHINLKIQEIGTLDRTSTIQETASLKTLQGLYIEIKNKFGERNSNIAPVMQNIINKF